MASEGNSFLPRILSVFYAVFHDNKGTNIVYQVPEGLILTSPTQLNTCISGNTIRTFSPEKAEGPSTASSESRETSTANPSRASSLSRYSHLANSRETFGSPFVGSSSANSCLFKFEDISRYVIPPSPLCGRLVTCTTRRHQIIGFPVELFNEERYERNFFRYNVCFVFDRTADLSCYEPIVRKIGRVLTTCEEESSFLSSPETADKIPAILEQLFEDLNSYSETSIPIDKFNSIELKIFPFYPNPPEVRDWEVPVALINLKKRVEDNWDLTMAKVCQYIDGTNHVSRIAYLADCDLDLTRKAIQHLLFYQVIMMIDIFQFSNMYTMCRSIAWLADEAHVRDECGPYVTRPDREISEWPDLLHLYSRLKPGITVFEWMLEYNTHKHGIDPRRFVSFGVIKGFLRRVHRWPVLIQQAPSEKDRERRTPSSASASFGRRRGKSFTMAGGTGLPVVGPISSGITATTSPSPPFFSGTSDFSYLNKNGEGLGRHPSLGEADRDRLHRPGGGGGRRASAAEKYLEQFRREIDRGIIGDGRGGGAKGGANSSAVISPPTSGSNPNNTLDTSPRAQRYARAGTGEGRGLHKNSFGQPGAGFISAAAGPGPGTASVPGMSAINANCIVPDFVNRGENGDGSGFATPTPATAGGGGGGGIGSRPHPSRSPSSASVGLMQAYSSPAINLNLNLSGPAGSGPNGGVGVGVGTPVAAAVGASNNTSTTVPAGLKELLDGTHHADELGVQFELGWPALEKHLVAIGGGKGDGDFGRVEIIYR